MHIYILVISMYTFKFSLNLVQTITTVILRYSVKKMLKYFI